MYTGLQPCQYSQLQVELESQNVCLCVCLFVNLFRPNFLIFLFAHLYGTFYRYCECFGRGKKYQFIEDKIDNNGDICSSKKRFIFVSSQVTPAETKFSRVQLQSAQNELY